MNLKKKLRQIEMDRYSIQAILPSDRGWYFKMNSESKQAIGYNSWRHLWGGGGKEIMPTFDEPIYVLTVAANSRISSKFKEVRRSNL
jgi:hypothetical protein